MALSKSTINISGKVGDLAKATILGVTTNTALGTFITAYMAHSDGGLQSTHFSERVVTDGEAAVGSNSDRRGSCYFQDIDTGNIVKLTLVAPKAADVENVTGRDGGERIKLATLEALRDALETATGRDLKVLYGYVIQKK